jgi:ethanolaminephosphotransferase
VSRLLLCVTLAGILVWTIVRFRTSLIYRNGPSRLYSLAVLVITLITSIPIFIYKILTERAGNDETDTIKRVLSVLNTTDLARSAYAGIAILYVLAWLPIRKYHIYIRQSKCCLSAWTIHELTLILDQRLWTCLLATTLLLLLLSRMHNAFLYMLAFAQLYLLERQVRLLKSLLTPTSTWAMVPTRYATVIPLTCLAVPIICLQQSAFFSFGNANSISSIDLSNAYTGLTSYIPVLVGLLTFIANWAGPIWWHVAAIYVLCSVCETTQPPMRGSRQEVQSMKDSTAYEQWTGSIHLYLWGNALFYGASLISLTLAMITHRHHLFIWEVFSPKYLYQMAWMVFHLLSVSWTVIWHIWST